MRLRPAVILSSFALAALALAGCSGAPAETAEGSALCEAALPEGKSTKDLKIGGEFGAVPTMDSKVAKVTDPQRTVVIEGDGDPLEEGQWIDYSIAQFDAASGELLGSQGFDDTEVPPLQISASTGAGQYFGCATVGSRVAVTAPGNEQGAASVIVVDINKIVDAPPSKAWGEPQEPVEGQPTVELGKDGAPTITLPDTAPPTETVVTTLKKGDGDEVQPGSDVTVQYTGVQWSDGSVFDSSWERGAPATFNTGQVVTGFRVALEGQTVGSQVLVTMPPKDGYGEGEKAEGSLVGETLTFVVDILAAIPPAQ